MSDLIERKTKQLSPVDEFKEMVKSPAIQKRLEELLGQNPASYVSSAIQVMQNNSMLAKASPQSVMSCVVSSAILKMSINPNIGHAYIVPYGNQAQLQIGYKGFVQLAIRSGLFQTINACAIYDGDTNEDVLRRITSILPDDREGEKPVAYTAYFKLLNGFEAFETMSVDKIQEHKEKFSKSGNRQGSVWDLHFDSMAMKTVMKRLLTRKAPLSVDMERAIVEDEKVGDEDILGPVSKKKQSDVTVGKTKTILDDAQFAKLVENVQNGTMPYEKAVSMYELTKEQADTLESL